MRDEMDILEKRIKDRFEEISGKSWFSEEIEEDNFQLRELLWFFQDLKGKTILEIGCASGRFVKQLAKRGAHVTGIDISERLIERARRNVSSARFFVGSATNLPFTDGEFDYVYSIETFEHIPDTGKGISEACRVLKEGGKIVIIDKNYFGLHPNFLMPNPIRKFVLETVNKTMYENKFGYKERHFKKSDLDSYLGLYCRRRHTRFLPGFRPGPKMSSLKKRFPALVNIKIIATNMIYRLLPFTSYCIAWRWEK
ncbi:MAG: class I SAM-dependent methyltransferase [Candidatus Omnitrophica bacterium]|nr:class I SAM-dependent methyltransferase [Candidatus Omnitrophota bacterium]